MVNDLMGIKMLNGNPGIYGNIKIGKKGKGKIDHFLLTTTQKDADGVFIEDTLTMEKLKKSDKTMVNKDGNLISIPVKLNYDNLLLNFPHQLRYYNKGMKSCYGNMETALDRTSNFTVEKKCPCSKLADNLCKFAGKLTAVIEEAQFFGPVYAFRTTGRNSVESIVTFLNRVSGITDGIVAGIEFTLIVTNQSVSKGTIQVVTLAYQGSKIQLIEEAKFVKSNRKNQLIDMKLIESDAVRHGNDMITGNEDDERDFIEEFVPNAVGNDVPKPQKISIPQPTPEDDQPVYELPPIKNCNNEEKEKSIEEKIKDEKPGIKTVVIRPEDKLLIDKIKETDNNNLKISLVKRLTKPGLQTFLETEYPENTELWECKLKPDFIQFYENEIKKTETTKVENSDEYKKTVFGNDDLDTMILIAEKGKQIDLVNHMREFFSPRAIPGTFTIPKLLQLAEKIFREREVIKAGTAKGTIMNPEKIEIKTNVGDITKLDQDIIPEEIEIVSNTSTTNNDPTEVGPPDHFQWDSGPGLQTSQGREIGNYKTALGLTLEQLLEKANKYRDKDGNRLTTCKSMTCKQADHFLGLLCEELNSKGK